MEKYRNYIIQACVVIIAVGICVYAVMSRNVPELTNEQVKLDNEATLTLAGTPKQIERVDMDQMEYAIQEQLRDGGSIDFDKVIEQVNDIENYKDLSITNNPEKYQDLVAGYEEAIENILKRQEDIQDPSEKELLTNMLSVLKSYSSRLERIKASDPTTTLFEFEAFLEHVEKQFQLMDQNVQNLE